MNSWQMALTDSRQCAVVYKCLASETFNDRALAHGSVSNYDDFETLTR